MVVTATPMMGWPKKTLWSVDPCVGFILESVELDAMLSQSQAGSFAHLSANAKPMAPSAKMVMEMNRQSSPKQGINKV